MANDSTVPGFDAFYRAANRGRSPFPWQVRLARDVIDSGWPDEIGVPTGLGKTSCIDVAVWAMAQRAAAPPVDRLPTRVWWVVNRRLLVDAAFEHGQRLAAWLRAPATVRDFWPEATSGDIDVLAAVAAAVSRLAAFGTETGPLYVTRMRGGADLGARPPEPSQPSIIFATVAMFGSRWLFRGYGSSQSMRPVDAALAGTDSMVLLDEAHLARALIALSGPAAECDPGDPTRVISPGRSRPRVVSLTATGERLGQRFDLDDDDLDHPVVRQRLDADKPVRLQGTTKKDLAAALAREAVEELSGGSAPRACLVFANTPSRAREVMRHVERLTARITPVPDVVMLTGRMRDHEADRARARITDPITGAMAGMPPTERSRALIIVATQTLEVGADLDVDHLVSQSAGVRSITQRFGRLNRLGTRPWASGVICHAADADEAIYGDEPAALWSRLTSSMAADDVAPSLSPRTIAGVLGPPSDAPADPPELLPSLVWEWAKTTIAPSGEAPVEVFLDDDRESVARVSVCWRAHLPTPGTRLRPRVTAAESVEIPVSELRTVLAERVGTEVLRLAGDRSSIEEVAVAELRPGDVCLLGTTTGLYDESGWNPTTTGEVLDVGLLRAGTLPLTRSAVTNLVADPARLPELTAIIEQLGRDRDQDSVAEEALVDDRTLVSRFLDALRAARPHAWIEPDQWQAYCDRLSPVVVRQGEDVAFLAPQRVSRGPTSAPVRADAFDDFSFGFDAGSVGLTDHLESVGEAAARIAEAIGIAPPLVSTVRLAGRLHDVGKSDPRFQRWLDPAAESAGLLAKSTTPQRQSEGARAAAGWPKGGRHEVISTRLVQSWLPDQRPDELDGDLLAHLVLSHHGQGRPSVRCVADPASVRVTAQVDGVAVSVSADLAAPEWSQPARFRSLCERYGYWGLALLEAVVRQADHAASSQAEHAPRSVVL